MKKTLLQVVFFVVAATIAVPQVTASVLWWMTNKPIDIMIYGSEEEDPDFTTPMYSAQGVNVTDARVRVFGDGISDDEPVYLNIYYDDGTGNIVLDDGYGTMDSTWIVDNGMGNDDRWAELAQYADNAYSFAIELGNFDEAGGWNSWALSETATYDQLNTVGGITAGQNYISEHVLEEPGSLPWSPRFRAVPEPSTALLILGGALLVAARRRKIA